MSLCVTTQPPTARMEAPTAGTPAQREAFKSLAQALRADHLGAAAQAVVAIVKQAPAGAAWHLDSPFAALGRALKAGDLLAAKEAATQMPRDLRPIPHPHPTPDTAPPEPVSSTGGIAGSLLSMTAWALCPLRASHRAAVLVSYHHPQLHFDAEPAGPASPGVEHGRLATQRTGLGGRT